MDDHPEVHAAIRGAVRFQYFFGPQRHPVPDWRLHAATWADAVRLIGESVGEGASRTPAAGAG